MNLIKKSVFALGLLATLSACSGDDSTEAAKTSATITVTSAQGPVANMVVYVYDETQWSVIGDNPNFAQGQASTDEQGNATFSNLEYPAVFHDINNHQNTMRFSAHYALNNVQKTKVVAITFNKGEQKTGMLHLD